MLSKHFTTSDFISLSTGPQLWTSRKKVIGPLPKPVRVGQKYVLKHYIQ